MYTKGMRTYSCLARVFHRLPRNVFQDDDGRKIMKILHNVCSGSRIATLNVLKNSNFVSERHFSVCSRHLVVDYRVTFDNCFHSRNFELHTPAMRLRTECVSPVSKISSTNFSSTNSTRRYVSRSAMLGPPDLLLGHPSMKPKGDCTSRCSYCATVPADGGGQGKPEALDLEALAKKVIESAKKRDVMASTVPLRKVVSLLETLHHQGFSLDRVTDVLGQQLQFLLDPESLTSLTEFLLTHDFRRNSIILFLENIPFIENTSLKTMKNSLDDSIKHLITMGFEKSDLRSFLTTEPTIFFTNIKMLNSRLSQLKGLFTSADALCVIKKSPNVFSDPWDKTREKFDYAYFTMGYKQAAILNSCLFQHDLEHIEDRHQFLLRAGFFYPVKEKDDPALNPNPLLGDAIDSLDKVFARKFGGFSVDEYKAYLTMREIEREEDDDNVSDVSDTSEEEEEEEGNVKKAKHKQLKKK